MSRKQVKKKSTRSITSPSSPATSNKKKWDLRPIKKWVYKLSDKMLLVYALPLTRFTEAKVRNLKNRLEHVSHNQ
jgi:hypothetical protein